MKEYTKEFFIACGKKGGSTTAKRNSKEFYKKIGKLGSIKRWPKKVALSNTQSQKAGIDQ